MSHDDNDSTRKLGIREISKPDGTKWIAVYLKKWGRTRGDGTIIYPEFWPSFRDLHRIIRAIGACEDLRYPPPYDGRLKLADFLFSAGLVADFDELARKYNIPERDNGRLVNANGARVDGAGLPLFEEPETRWTK